MRLDDYIKQHESEITDEHLLCYTDSFSDFVNRHPVFLFNRDKEGRLRVLFDAISNRLYDELWDYYYGFEVKPENFVWCDWKEYGDMLKKSIKESVDRKLSSDEDNTVKWLVRHVKEKGGSFIKDRFGYKKFIAVSATDEDYYFVLVDENLKFEFSSAVGSIEYVGDEEVPERIRNHIMEHKEELTEELMKKPYDYVFTDIVF